MLRKDFLNAIQTMRPGLSKKSIMDHSDKFGFVVGGIMTYNSSFFYFYECDEIDFTGVINSDTIIKFLKECKTEGINIFPDGPNLCIESGNAIAKLPYIDDAKIVEIREDDIDQWFELSDRFITGLSLCAESVSTNYNYRPETCFIKIDAKSGYIESINGQILTRFFDQIELDSDAYIPESAVKNIIKFNPVEIGFSKKFPNWLFYHRNDEFIFGHATAKVENFPDLDPLIPKGKEYALIELEPMLNASKRAKAFIEDDEQVEVSISNKGWEMKAETEKGFFRETGDEKIYDGPNLVFRIGADTLQHICGFKTECIIENERICIEVEDNFVFVSMIRRNF